MSEITKKSNGKITLHEHKYYFLGKYLLSKKQVRKILAGKWQNKSDEFVCGELERVESNKGKKLGYQILLKNLLNSKDPNSKRTIVLIELALVERGIDQLRRDKVRLRRELKALNRTLTLESKE